MIELRRLQAFVAVAEDGHITRAAERLGMQQPPLSRLLQGLEAQLGCRLLIRRPRGVEPTAAGLALLEEARAVLARAAAVEDAVRRAARGQAGRLAVGFTSSAALHPFVPATIRHYRETCPGVQMELDEAGTAELVEAVLVGRLDAAFVRSPVGNVAGLLVEPLLEEPMVAALPAGHRLALEGGSPLPLSDLSSDPFVLYRRRSGPGLYDAILAACREAGFTPTLVQEAPRLPATLSLVASGLGTSIVPASIRHATPPGIAYRAIDTKRPLVAPILLILRKAGTAATATRFGAVAKALASRAATSGG
ncbi:LysR substrate-binding domain-containing protein [Falsiroseomonas sp.]|uniref:LysR substrate-binding domain-containing protein n=1 Tax=Falsiroseomonas sp. TaxID=2870721 RepID=UPI0034A1AA5C